MRIAERFSGELSLCWGTLQDADFKTLVQTAATAGFSGVTLNTILCADARQAGISYADMRTMLADNGLFVSNIDPTPGWSHPRVELPGDEFFPRLSRSQLDDVFELANEVDADLINAPVIFTEESSEQAITDGFGALCVRAATLGIHVSLEFMPISPIADLPSAARVINQVNADNGGIMLDCWHFRRTGGLLEDLSLVSGDRYFGVQLDDVSELAMADTVDETMNHRLLPGQGHGEVHEIVSALRALDVSLVYDVEVFNTELRARSNLEQAVASFEAAEGVLRK